MSSYTSRLRRLEAALNEQGRCICRDIKAIVWIERRDTEEEFEAALQRARLRPKCPVHRRQSPLPIVRITRGSLVSHEASEVK